MLTPDQFKVNDAWIVLRVNESFIFVQDEPYDIYVLIDAASTYVLGHMLARVTDDIPKEKDVEILFQDAWEVKSEWPKKLIAIENDSAGNVFQREAQKNGLSFETHPLSELSPIVGPLKESFAANLGEPVPNTNGLKSK